MKKSRIFLMILITLTFVISACGSDKYEAEAIDEEKDTCDVCSMAVPDNQHATQIVLEDGKVLKFDDLGCLFKWKDENGEDKIGAEFVRDYNSEEWLEIKDATFAYDSEFETPMAYGVYSFQDKADAEELIDKEGKGELMTADELAEHKWEMNMDMMDHGDHDEHDEHEDDNDHDEHDDHEEHDSHDDEDKE